MPWTFQGLFLLGYIVFLVRPSGQETRKKHATIVSFLKKGLEGGLPVSISQVETELLNFQGSSRVVFQFSPPRKVVLRLLLRTSPENRLLVAMMNIWIYIGVRVQLHGYHRQIFAF